MPRSPAQAQASRTNGARSRGPVTPEGKARAAQNARSSAMRSTDACLADFEEVGRFHELEQSVYDRYRPLCPLEAALCARIAMALWRAERADQLEAEFWCLPVPASKVAETLPMASGLLHEPGERRRALPTILRYQAEAMNAVTRAIKALALLRAGQAEPDDEAPPANQNQPVPAEAAPAKVIGDTTICTNEPEATAGPAAAGEEPRLPRARLLCANEPENAFARASLALPGPHAALFCTNEPGLSPPAPCSPARAAPPR